MQLRNIPGVKWPPDWGRAYQRGEKFEIGENGGTLAALDLKSDHIELLADFSGKQPRGVIHHEDIEVLKRIEKAVKPQIGKSLRVVGDTDVPDR